MRNALLVFGLLFTPHDVVEDVEEDGVELYQQGRYPRAAEAFRQAVEKNPDDGELSYNLALTLWRLGQRDAAETAAERAAAVGGYDGLRDGVLGNLRYDQAREISQRAAESADEVRALEEAITTVGTALDHYQRGVLELEARAPTSGAALLRNLERALALEDELIRQLEEAQERQRQERSQREQDQEEDEETDEERSEEERQGTQQESQSDEKKDEEEQEAAEQERDQKQEDQKQEEQQKEDQQQEEQQQVEQSADQERGDPPPGESGQVDVPESDRAAPVAPGEHDPNSALSPEQKRQILDMLSRLEEQLKTLRNVQRRDRPKVKKDW